MTKEHGEQALGFELSFEQCYQGKLEVRIENTGFRRFFKACEISASCVNNLATTNEFVFRQEGENVDPSQWLSRGGAPACMPRAISPSILTEETRRIVSGWLSKCSEHETCRPPTDQILPTRIINVKDPQCPRLAEKNGAEGHYVALSHCWGGGKDIYKTTTGLLRKHISGIEFY